MGTFYSFRRKLIQGSWGGVKRPSYTVNLAEWSRPAGSVPPTKGGLRILSGLCSIVQGQKIQTWHHSPRRGSTVNQGILHGLVLTGNPAHELLVS